MSIRLFRHFAKHHGLRQQHFSSCDEFKHAVLSSGQLVSKQDDVILAMVENYWDQFTRLDGREGLSFRDFKAADKVDGEFSEFAQKCLKRLDRKQVTTYTEGLSALGRRAEKRPEQTKHYPTGCFSIILIV